MHYLKATAWVLLALAAWIAAYFVAAILFISLAIYVIATIIKMEKDDVKDN